MSENNDYVNIIFLSSDWDIYHRRAFTESLADKLNTWSDMILLQLPVSLFIHIFTRFKRKIVGLIKGRYKTVKTGNNSYLFTPVILFHYLIWNKSNLFFRIDYFLLQFQLNRFIRKNIGIRKSIIWYYFPYLKRYVEKSNADIKIYDQYDIYHMDVNGNVDGKLKNINDELIKMSDLVFNTTKYLNEISVEINKNSYYVTNGNNFILFSKSNNESVNINLPVKGAKTIGYLGGIRDWIDFDLLEYVISKKSDVNFLFIGSVYPIAKNKLEKLKSYKNFMWLDFIPQENLPAYLSVFDAGLIPFKTTDFFKCVFPNKFYEYMASGIPVITTYLPELIKFEDIIGLSKSKSDFLANCEKALSGHFDEFKNQYLKISKENAWFEKVNEINGIVKKFIVR